MAFYDLDKKDRDRLVSSIQSELVAELHTGDRTATLRYFSDDDTYIRKSAYLSVGRIYSTYPALRAGVLALLEELSTHDDFRVRQTVINSAGEIAKSDFGIVRHFFDTGLFDAHHSPRNAVIGSIKKSGAVNPQPVLRWAQEYLNHPDKEIRREVCHGIELRGRSHPEDILPLLRELQYDKTARVRNTLVHVIGQISYRKGSLEKVLRHLLHWENKALVSDALDELVRIHQRDKDFMALSESEAIALIEQYFPDFPTA
ncbi:MAG TPA: HEAT repeat domain-containing protein [Saprospiraceae bacterium]|nr:HEAT repeat domain-containing protein [Saprospiraceae bacterium]HNM24470.1 HEAT repeat domain-containing protein [Saprospiraceae bacterium]